VLDGLVDGEVVNPIVVPEPTKGFARVALERMLNLA
jgi:quinolinate synthase